MVMSMGKNITMKI